MASEAERRKVLEMIDSGKLTAAEGLHLMNILMDLDDEPQPEEKVPSRQSESTINDQNLPNKLKWLWQIPLWIGIILTVLGAFAIFQAMRLSGFGVWFILAWLPFIAGILWMVFAWECRSCHWLYFKFQKDDEETHRNYSFGFPLPLRFISWVLHFLRDKIPYQQNKSIEQLIEVLDSQTSSNNPISIDINGNEGGKRIQLVIG